MSGPADAVFRPRVTESREERYRRRAEAAVKAANGALPRSYNTQESEARMEALGRIAAALILADKDED